MLMGNKHTYETINSMPPTYDEVLEEVFQQSLHKRAGARRLDTMIGMKYQDGMYHGYINCIDIPHLVCIDQDFKTALSICKRIAETMYENAIARRKKEIDDAKDSILTA